MPAAGVRTVSVSRREGDSGEPGGRPGGAECSGLEYLHVRIGSMQEERPLAPLVIRHLGLRRRCGVKCGPLHCAWSGEDPTTKYVMFWYRNHLSAM